MGWVAEGRLNPQLEHFVLHVATYESKECQTCSEGLRDVSLPLG